MNLIRLSSLVVVLCGQSQLSHSFGAEKPPAKGAGERYAILIGVDDYAELEDLKFCGADQLALKQALVKAGFPEEQVFLLHDQAKESKYRPYKANIEKQLDLVLNLAERDDVLLFGFSGHGAHLDGQSYLLPAEANVDDKTTLISRDKVYRKLQDCKASLKVALIDACRDDPRPAGRRSVNAKEDLTQLAKSLEKVPEGLLLFTSCAPGEVSMEDKQFGHGVFMNFILEGLQGKADSDSNRAVTLKELFTYAGQKTKLHVARTFNGYQTPRKNSAEADAEVEDFAIVKLDNALAKSEPPVIPKVSSVPRPVPSPPIPPLPSVSPKPAEITTTATDPAPLPTPNVKPGKVITNSIGMKLVEIPAGEFLMGSRQNDKDAGDDEKPLHHVKIGKPFYIGAYEVTRGEFLKFYHDAQYKTDAENHSGGVGYAGKADTAFETRVDFVPWNTGFPQTNDHPVTLVSWNDAKAFCAWLSKKEGKQYRLPTEAEWEYACRASTVTRFSCGDESGNLVKVANIADASLKRVNKHFNGADYDDKFPFTAPVGSFAPNGFGLYDMHGNIREWCEDRYSARYYKSLSDQISVDPRGNDAGTYRVIRGGGWFSLSTGNCRSAHRYFAEPAERDCDNGFRVVLQSP